MIRLDLTFFVPTQNPPSFAGALFVSLTRDGKVQVINYSPVELAVVAVYEGTLPELESNGLFLDLDQPFLKAALREKDFTGKGFEEGDSFALTVEQGPTLVSECYGLLHKAPGPVKSLVDKLVDLWKELEKKPLQDAYLRSSRIQRSRFERLTKAGKLPFRRLADFPDDLRLVVTDAILRPIDFHVLSLNQYQALLRWSSHGNAIFVAEGNEAFQLTPYVSKTNKRRD